MPSAFTDGAFSSGQPSNSQPGAATRNGPSASSNNNNNNSSINMTSSSSASKAKPPRATSPQLRAATGPSTAAADQALGSAKVAVSFVRRIGQIRKPPPNNPLQQSGADGDDGRTPGSDSGVGTYQSPQPIVTETEVVEPLVPGSMVGGVVHDDSLDALVTPPALEHNAVADYVATAENWIMTDRMLAHHEELVARGLLMIRNVVRSEPRFAVQNSGTWLPLVRDSLGSKHGLVRAAAASTLAAFAASTPHREALHKDHQVVPRLVQMLTNGLAAGGDNNDTQYACLALSNMALNSSYRQPLLRYGALPRAADVLRAAIQYVHALNHDASGGAAAGGGGGGGLHHGKSFKGVSGGGVGGNGGNGARQKSSSLLKSAAYVAALLTAWAVEPHGREQLQQYDVPSLASKLYETCVTALGDEFPLSRRLALLADTSSAAALLEEIAGVAEEAGVMSSESGSQEAQNGEGGNGSPGGHPPHPAAHGNPHSHALRGVSFLEAASRGTGPNMGRTAMAMNSLHRLIDADSPSETGTGGIGSQKNVNTRGVSKKQLAATAVANAHTMNGSVPSSPIIVAPTSATTTTITATTTTTTVTNASSAPLSPTLLSPRDGASGGGVSTPRGSRLFNQRLSQAGFAALPSAAPLGALLQTSSAGQLASPFAHRQSGFSDASFPMQAGVTSGITSPVSSQQHPQLSSSITGSGSMSGVHFSASVFVDAAAAAAAARGSHGDDDGQHRNGQQSLLTQVSSQSPAIKALKLPAVASGRVSESRSSGPPSARSSEHHSSGARLDLPFHLVRPIPTISASSGKVSRMSAAYGHVANSRQPSNTGSAHPLHSYSRSYASEM
ncbi:hypothetical protein VaNZ11_012301 [Volvox africanus]|uniref:TOG domain-containing protein n=1 Tax=Volvox africanus TaxID=51714 RepID=A0ABQ5SDK7_9CHLO|nr:hypothetical protein VaNZ11_012301 [Volvox africanus]